MQPKLPRLGTANRRMRQWLSFMVKTGR